MDEITMLAAQLMIERFEHFKNETTVAETPEDAHRVAWMMAASQLQQLVSASKATL